MPELPEVEAARALIEARALGREIAAVDDSDVWVCRPHAPGELSGALTGRTLTAARRIGKTMWCETDGGVRLGLHLGMTGRIVVDDASAGDPQPRSAGTDAKWSRFALDFADGGRMYLFDKRRLGRAVLDPDLHGLGPDAYAVGKSAFRERVGRGAMPVKAKLLDQGVIAGVGNLLADETLWRARVSPLHPAGDLSDEELDVLRRELRGATRSALRHGGVHTGKLIPHRTPGGTCPRCGAELQRASVGGRTTWWCPAEQA
ncbi:MAG TPA: DNA-formamidopyrimidine glycosylase family protein [Baekduia sp.]|nr:DNA-formamidopyrimidine glycosylase family protein [Baekduia sp.]